MDIYNKPTDSKLYAPFTSNHTQYCLTNIPFSYIPTIYTIVENENALKDWKNIARTKIP